MQEALGQNHLTGAEKPFSESCERNKRPILERLRETFNLPARILEIGSGTGQHAVHFGEALPHLIWQTSDLPANHCAIRSWLEEAALPNVLSPIVLDVNGPWPHQEFDGVFTANTLHIVSWDAGQRLIAGAARLLKTGGRLVIYGPFNYNGDFTSDSNARFDEWLKGRDPVSGIRDIEAVTKWAEINNLRIQSDHAMPANNRLLVFVKI
jgi:SAM-dependent methyltransferase